jgi:hypothetical protein
MESCRSRHVWETGGVVFVADDLAAWLVGFLADAGRKKLTTLTLGTDQERALRAAATAAVQLTAEELRPGNDAQTEQVALVISQVFSRLMPSEPLVRHRTILEALQAGIAEQLAPLNDASLTGTGQSSLEVLEVSAPVLAEKLTSHLLRDIVSRGVRGGPLFPLASQLNDDVTHLQGERLEEMVGRLASDLRTALVRLERQELSQAAGAVAKPNELTSLGGSRHALIIVTSAYDDPRFHPSRVPSRDAGNFASVLGAAEIGGFNVSSIENATMRETRQAIQEFLSGRVVEDEVLVYVSSHSVRNNNGDLYFVVADTRQDALADTGVESQWLLNRLDDCVASSQILILDCSFGEILPTQAKSREVPGLDDLFGRRGRGRAILAASRSYEFSSDDFASGPREPARSYTTGLVEGLRSGEADSDHDGYISVLDAHNYAYSYVKRVGVDQAPLAWLYGSQGQVWLARNPRVQELRELPVSSRDREPMTTTEPASQRVALFELAPDDLGSNCAIPHALDDQWVSRTLISDMAVSRKSLHELGEKRDSLIRREYIRALITAKRIVVNRSYLLKNEVISRDYKTDPVSRAAFIELLREGAIVPFLLKERTPIESEFAAYPDAAKGAKIWNELLSESDAGGRGRVEVRCVRLSWDDAENERLVQEHLFDAFASGVTHAASLDYPRLLADVGANRSDAFDERLRLMPKMTGSWQRTGLSRTALYQRYVVDDQEDVSTGKYDFTKPDMVAFKWLFDLIYNSNLATTLGLALISPADSAHRAFVCHQKEAGKGSASLNVLYEEGHLRTSIMEAVQHAIFASDYSSASLAIFDGLTLSDVIAIRNSEAWQRYTQALDSLLEEPWLMSHPERGLPFVYGRFAELIKHISGITPTDLGAGVR